MTVFIIQSLLLLAVAFILGCLLGSFLRYLFTPAPQPVAVAAPAPAPLVSKPAPKPAPTPKPAAPKPAPAVKKAAPKPRPKPTFANKDNLQEIWGIGNVLEKKLHDIGVYRFDQIAAWTKKDVADFNSKLSFSGRIERDEWLKQAAKLAKKSKA